MAKALQVCIGNSGILVGTLRFEAQGNREFSSFEYADTWIDNPRGFAIAPSMPLDGGQFFYKKDGDYVSPLPMPIADTTPDSWGRNIIRRDARENRKDTSPLNELDYLLSVDDFSRLGALRIREEGDDQPFLSSQPGGRHEIPPLLQLNQLGQSIASLERENPQTAEALKRLRQIGSALGGARPKCSVVDTDGTLLIAKFTSIRDTENVERAEVLTLNLAQQCGLNAPSARLDMSDGLPVALIRRFDRTAAGRLPYISAQTMLEAADATSGTYTQLAEAIRRHSDSPKRDLSELFNRVGFTILVSNVDDHLKNHGFLYTGNDQWRLSHIFDVNPAPERHRELKTAISEISGSEANLDALIEHAPFFDLTEDQAAQNIHDMATTINTNWEPLAERLGMTRDDIKTYRPAFEHREMTKALQLDQPGPGPSSHFEP
ncbi:type II toxin-antitoxin system HipA family toxin (plasmid) [Agrobacterium rosae]|uniref:Type II toxin-antitoxin system HipA family toxin n=1 Tax=Agrobacterium rosae TaxID=1972867 RepID=A0AAW9FJB9_9HYPH|nr:MULTISPECIES: type II toxin-antitoxin system HipA family toxin [Agrobacterium]MDX8321755.1 type II toxin-antitoxin system HipA family toxin [Agrobacterium sp. rho-8.1]MDX8305221.1 type II toxin-antitoxin system HipA family toxin [Agrobacterium rosae]MDX8311502.1 type II toxin-antitoxin system HipA family toxin [Agrobacterium sp. rho-13.3]MDX8316264.1 type II toxin-antitoxin system HipA family toxin [Agrobacterium rosae]MDX8332429.1 type II toxin-antitoxin system HipA family toxin [Agrobacte